MNISNAIKISFAALTNNKMRAFLTMLGIIIGVAFGHHYVHKLLDKDRKKVFVLRFLEMGSNMLMIQPELTCVEECVRAAMPCKLKLKDYEDIQNLTNYIAACSPSVSSGASLSSVPIIIQVLYQE